MGLSLERLLENKDKKCSPPWNHIAWGYFEHKIAAAVWIFNAPSKKKKILIFLSTSILSTFLQNWSKIYVASFFPPSLMCEVQSTMDTSIGGAFPHRTRMFKRGIIFIVAPSCNHTRLNPSTSCSNFEMFLSYVTWKFKLNNSPSLC